MRKRAVIGFIGGGLVAMGIALFALADQGGAQAQCTAPCSQAVGVTATVNQRTTLEVTAPVDLSVDFGAVDPGTTYCTTLGGCANTTDTSINARVRSNIPTGGPNVWRLRLNASGDLANGVDADVISVSTDLNWRCPVADCSVAAVNAYNDFSIGPDFEEMDCSQKTTGLGKNHQVDYQL